MHVQVLCVIAFIDEGLPHRGVLEVTYITLDSPNDELRSALLHMVSTAVLSYFYYYIKMDL